MREQDDVRQLVLSIIAKLRDRVLLQEPLRPQPKATKRPDGEPIIIPFPQNPPRPDAATK